MSDKISDIAALAQALWFLPPPARAQIAPQLWDLGVRLHPELATKRLVREGPAHLGNHAPQRLESIDAMAALRTINPDLAAKVEHARAAAEAGDRSSIEALGAELRATAATDREVIARHVGDLPTLAGGAQ